MLALGRTGLFGQLVRLGPVHPALVGEEQQPVMGGRDEEVLDDVVLAQRSTLHALATTAL